MQAQQDNSTLSELTLDEVFASRLQQEGYFNAKTEAEISCENEKESSVHKKNDTQIDSDIENNNVLEHKQRLQTLFKQTVAQVLAKEST
jgi:hypothetical protein